ncbi:Pentatricopeptide repeat-containing protein 1, mitochondrial [Armadillidium nasatum]|uniref:Pentatricopeptide repeat-containing protein 1, mitochondrial n=1 Tax=Armadillidium nasatum TaxID=96803 RepID=A0A5N5SJ65_9CRUS|nr:Pentatricopeptide repeat-containing protein 1, mitochondrial [Armadillidium nasatum]
MNGSFLNYKLNMWRFFRLGIKSNACPGNQAHFRIIGTTCANADCDEVEDVNCPSNKNNFKASRNKENFASVASKRFHKTLQAQENVELKRREKRKDAYKSFGAYGKPVLRENSQNQNENPKNKNKIRKHKSSSSEISEKDLDLSMKDEGIEDIEFGALAEDTRNAEFLPDEPDAKSILLPRVQAHSYGRIMLELCKERKIKEALNILEVEMKEKDVAPDNYCYNVLINACGKMGYAEKAFELYYKMKQRGLRVEKFAYTGLFNSCANSPMKPKGLELATTLRKQLKDKAVVLHPITYHSMIKAFGHCGDIKTAFEIVDEMVYGGLPVTSETLCFLLQACFTDKETGFRHALMVWRQVRSLLIQPNVFTYNMLLRCVRDCGAGDPQLLSELLDDLAVSHKIKGKLKRVRDKKRENAKYVPSSFSSSKKKNDQDVKVENGSTSNVMKGRGGEEEEEYCQISDGNEVVKVNLKPNMELEIISPEKGNSNDEEPVLPNVLSYKVQPGNIIAISSLEKKEERMWLLGGITGILNSMKEDRVKPNIVTFNTILESLPDNFEVEESLLSTMENLNVEPDVIFCNRLIRKRCMRNCLEEAKDVLTLMQKHTVPLDIVTYGCLALGCRKPSDIRQLLRDMKNSSIIPNEHIMNVLVLNSVKKFEFALAIELLQRMRHLNVPVKEELLNILEKARTESEPSDKILTKREERVRDEMKLFLMEYKHWLKTSNVELKEHPWAQFGYSEKGRVVARKS